MSNVIDPIKPSVKILAIVQKAKGLTAQPVELGRVGNVIEKLTLGPR